MRAAIYSRVSTVDKAQRPEVQEEILEAWVKRLDPPYEPVLFREAGISGATTSRPELDRLMKAVRRREVQAVAVLKLDRLGRSLLHLLQLLQEFDAHGARLLIHDQAIDTGTPAGKAMFSMLGIFSEFERSMIAERVKAGMAYAKSHGTRTGRPTGRPPAGVDIVKVCEALALDSERGAIPRVAGQFGVSPAWVYKWVVPVLHAPSQTPPVSSDTERQV